MNMVGNLKNGSSPLLIVYGENDISQKLVFWNSSPTDSVVPRGGLKRFWETAYINWMSKFSTCNYQNSARKIDLSYAQHQQQF